MSSAPSLIEAKAELRRSMRAARRQLSPETAAQASRLASERALDVLRPTPREAIGAFFSLLGEIDTAPLIAAILDSGGTVALPRMVGKGRPLAFHRWQPGEPLETGSMGVRQPLSSSPEAEPRQLIVPLLAFDVRGYRLGYGGGFYDRTLSLLRRKHSITAIGFAFDLQEISQVPAGEWDQPLDAIVTEARTILVPAPC